MQAACSALGLTPPEDDDAPPYPAAQLPELARLGSCRVQRDEQLGAGPIVRLPSELEAALTVDCWLQITETGGVEILSGRSELGQGVHLALRQIVATQLGVEVERVTVQTATTTASPDEGYNSGSRSMQQGGLSLAMAAVALRRALLQRAVRACGVPEQAPIIMAKCEIHVDGSCRLSFRELVEDQPVWRGDALGVPTPRPDLVAKLSGRGAFVQELQLEGMLHARAVLPPTYDAELAELDAARVAEMSGVCTVVRDGRLVLVVAEDETTVVRAATALAGRSRWENEALALSIDALATFRGLTPEPYTARDDDGVERRLGRGRRITAYYSKPYQAHAAIAPSCAVAVADGEHVNVWSHTQGVYPLRAELAVLLGEAIDDITVVHTPDPGCYGQNGADDAAGFAAIAARAVPGSPVRFQFSSADEFGWEPYWSAMAADLDASIDDEGAIDAWRHRAETDVHGAHPPRAGRPAGRLMAASRWRPPPPTRRERGRSPQRRSDLRPAHRPSHGGPREGALAYRVASGAWGVPPCVRDRVVHGRTGRTRGSRPAGIPAGAPRGPSCEDGTESRR